MVRGVDARPRRAYSPVMAGKKTDQRLTEIEGRVLALIARLGSPTAYAVYAVIDDTPTSVLKTSKGTIYPLVDRLKERGFLAATPLTDDRRGGETLQVTKAGMDAIRAWLVDIREEHVLVYDPLRARVPALQFLTPEERLEWVASAKLLNQQKADDVEGYRPEDAESFEAIAHLAAASVLGAQSKWLDRLFVALVDEARQVRGATKKER